MEKIRQIDNKILQLKHMKEQVEIKQARALFRKVQGILGQETDVNLATLILEETWGKTSEENKEVWRNKADSFRSGRFTKVTKLTEFRKAGETKSAKVTEALC